MSGIIDAGIMQAGVLSKSVAGSGSVALTASEREKRHQLYTGVLTGAREVVLGSAVALAGMEWVIYNNTTGAFSLTVKCETGSGVAVTQGKRQVVACDGTDVVAVMTDAAGSGFAAAGANTDITSLSGLVPGAAAATVRAGGSLHQDTTQVGNVGSSEVDLMAYTVPAAALAVNGQRLRFWAFGTYAANANNKTVKAMFGATTILDTGAIAANDGAWSIRGEIIRTGAAAQLAIVEIVSANASVSDSASVTTPAETLSGAVVLKLRGTGTSNNDIVQRGLLVEWLPN